MRGKSQIAHFKLLVYVTMCFLELSIDKYHIASGNFYFIDTNFHMV